MTRHRAPRKSRRLIVLTGFRRTRGAVMLAVLALVVGGTAVWIARSDRSAYVNAATTEWQFDRIAEGVDPTAGLTVVDRGRNRTSVTVGADGLTHGLPTAENAALYLQRSADQAISRIGVTVNFGLGDAARTGSAALIVADSSFPTDPERFDSDIPNMGIHFVFSASTWLMSVWEAGRGLMVLDTGEFVPRLTGVRSVDIVREASSATVELPDGSSRRFSDPRIDEWSGPVAVWELFEQKPSYVPVDLVRIWAA